MSSFSGCIGAVPAAEAGPGRRERADAAANRQRILAAAERLFAEQDPRTVTMGQVASAAGVGRATLYRRYPDVASLAVALLDEHERELQAAVISGPPPLGPGAPAGDRLAAFLAAMVDLTETHMGAALGAEIGAQRFRTGAYGFWRLHIVTLLREGEAPDPEALSDALLAALAPEVVRHQLHTLGLSRDRVADALAWTARRVLAEGG